ncbi:helix-turn-helix domain-containing protein [Asanoa sp. WMMD1127]|uniref:arsenate reductase/protein-tyrosine-phosphatase family protein n=1 Tax=Asanoa sp. WMMD1127 TaxID=3016107 RepID=UPI002415A3E7|nr:helix-turn-helix domain-containing protein [Asanoa sp. WMMD1127]MDG4820843.1 helix-turn-helix domain-containing protein [Asanoa sp. WMMD1127]
MSDYSVERRARVHAALADPARLAIVDRLALSDASPGELGRLLGQPTNLVAHHLGVLDAAGLIRRRRSEGDRRRSYLRLVPDVLSGLLRPPSLAASRVVFVCTHNSARSQLAAALLASRAPMPVRSAGTDPAAAVHPRAVAVGRRHGLDLAGARPLHVAAVVGPDDLVVSVCDSAHEQLPAARVHWSVPDPARDDTDAAFERAYAVIADRVDRLSSVLIGASA